MIKTGFVNVVFHGYAFQCKSNWTVYETDNIMKLESKYLPIVAHNLISTREINKQRNRIELDKYRYSFDCLK